jgi:hypothetical protein
MMGLLGPSTHHPPHGELPRWWQSGSARAGEVVAKRLRHRVTGPYGKLSSGDVVVRQLCHCVAGPYHGLGGGGGVQWEAHLPTWPLHPPPRARWLAVVKLPRHHLPMGATEVGAVSPGPPWRGGGEVVAGLLPLPADRCPLLPAAACRCVPPPAVAAACRCLWLPTAGDQLPAAAAGAAAAAASAAAGCLPRPTNCCGRMQPAAICCCYRLGSAISLRLGGEASPKPHM